MEGIHRSIRRSQRQSLAVNRVQAHLLMSSALYADRTSHSIDSSHVRSDSKPASVRWKHLRVKFGPKRRRTTVNNNIRRGRSRRTFSPLSFTGILPIRKSDSCPMLVRPGFSRNEQMTKRLASLANRRKTKVKQWQRERKLPFAESVSRLGKTDG